MSQPIITDSLVNKVRGLEEQKRQLEATGLPLGPIPIIVQGTDSLPTTPNDGDEVYYEFTENTNPASTRKHRWHLQWSAAAGFWFPISGTPIYALVDTLETTALTTYGNLTTVGPSITVPLAGDYDVTIEGSLSNNTAGDGARMSFDVGATAALDADSIFSVGPTDVTLSGTRRKTGLAASTALVPKYKALIGGTASFRFRRMIVRPIRIG